MTSPLRPTWAERWVFPGLVIAMVVGNQGWTVGPFLPGQMISWFVDLAALTVVARYYPGRRWPLLLGATIVVARAVGSGSHGVAFADRTYLWALNFLFFVTGTIMALRFLAVVHRQVRWLCMVSVFIMVLQVTGTGEWPQMLATENANQDKTPQPTLFVPVQALDYRTIQARPSGPLHSNNFLSLIVLFGIALQHSDRTRRRLNRWDYAVLLMGVLSMAKVVYLGAAILTGWLIFLGTKAQRVRACRFTIGSIVAFGMYAVLFPGLFDSQVNVYHIGYSFYVRANDFVDQLSPDNPLAQWAAPYLINTPRLEDESGETGFSGYAQALKIWPLLVVALVVAIPRLIRTLRFLRRQTSVSNSLAPLVGIVAIVFPAAVPFLGAQIFWFIVGFALFPLTIYLARRDDLTRRPAAGSASAI